MITGEIKINDDNLYRWRAVRKDSLGNGYFNYEVWVDGRNLAGYPVAGNFLVQHFPHEGALVLTRKVLQKAEYRLREVSNADDTGH